MIYILLAATGYSCLPIFTKTLLASGLDPIDLAAWRYVVAVPLFWLIALRRPVAPLEGRVPRLPVMVLGSLLALAAIAAFFGLQRTPAGTYVVIFYTYPTMVALISLFRGERLSSTGYGALLLTVVGIVLSTPGFETGFTADALPGLITALINALIVAVYFLWSNRLLRGLPPLRAGAWTVTGTLVTLLILAPLGGISVPSSLDAWVNLVLLAVISTVLPVFSLNIGIQKLGATKASIVSSFEPILTSVLALIFLNESMQPIQWLGAMSIVASVVILQLRPQPATKTVPEPL